MSFLRNVITWVFPVTLLVLLSSADVLISQDIDEQTTQKGPAMDIPNEEIDYIKIDPLRGNNRRPGSGCARIYGGGDQQWTEQFWAWGWNNGPNGIPQDGGGDDIKVRIVPAVWSTDVPLNIGRIFQNGLFRASTDDDCGEGYVLAEYEVFREGKGFEILSDVATIAVFPPDWLVDSPMQDLSKVGSDKE
jgi:hypothetical protein